MRDTIDISVVFPWWAELYLLAATMAHAIGVPINPDAVAGFLVAHSRFEAK